MNWPGASAAGAGRPWLRQMREHQPVNPENNPDDAGDSPVISCASCKACCCRLEVMLMGDDDIPPELTEQDRWGGWIMARLDDGWCSALDRNTLRCTIYDRRPMICHDYRVGDSDCINERLLHIPARIDEPKGAASLFS